MQKHDARNPDAGCGSASHGARAVAGSVFNDARTGGGAASEGARAGCGWASEGAKVRRDRAFWLAAKRLDWCALVALGYEAGSWLQIAVTADVADLVKRAQVSHPERIEPRLVLFVSDKVRATRVRDRVMTNAEAHHQRLHGGCVAMSVAEALAAIQAAAAAEGVPLASEQQWERAVEGMV